MGEKSCSMCGETKPVTAFHHRDGSPISWCKSCQAERWQRWAAKNRKQEIERSRKWAAENRLHLTQYNSLRYARKKLERDIQKAEALYA